MPESAFDWWVERTFMGTRVRVISANNTYEGWGRIWKEDKQAILLYDAEREDGERFDSVTVHDPVAVECLDEVKPIQDVPLEKIRSSPYDVRNEDALSDTGSLSKPASRIREIRLGGNLFSYPVVRTVGEDEYELVSGHRRTAAARCAKLETLPVRVYDLDDWEATCRFVFEHLPFPSQRPDQPGELYSEEKIPKALARLRERWSDEKLKELPQVAPLLDE